MKSIWRSQLAIVEQTTRFFRRWLCVFFDMTKNNIRGLIKIRERKEMQRALEWIPLVDVAESRCKKELEPQHIAVNVVYSILQLLSDFKLESESFAIFLLLPISEHLNPANVWSLDMEALEVLL